MQSVYFLLFLFIHLSGAQKAYEEKAGFGYWSLKHRGYLSQTAKNKDSIKAVFLGDSITDFWGWSGWGLDIWNREFKPKGAFNYGIAGDTTSGVLYRVRHGELDGIAPDFIVLLIGTNNIGSSPDADIAKGIQTIVGELRARMPSARIVLMGLLPRLGASADASVQKINSLIADTEGVTYIDLGELLRERTGVHKKGCFADYVHINSNGYKIWREAIQSVFNESIE